MIYTKIPKSVPPDKRAEFNRKILISIDAGLPDVTNEIIYNCYTGMGGLHELNRKDYANYKEYSDAKKQLELGQFFTPHEICRQMAGLLSVEMEDTVLDMCCGMGNFFNHFPNQFNLYGFDIDANAVKVAKRLYPDANITCGDIRTFNPGQRFDYIIGNPPFNLDFEGEQSQSYYFNKAYWALKPAGILLVIVPCSFMEDAFWDKSKIGIIDRDFSFLGQAKLPPDAFAESGVKNFRTKIMAFMRESSHIAMNPYNAAEFLKPEELKVRIDEAKQVKKQIQMDLTREEKEISKGEEEAFEYRLKKYLYELRTHKRLNKHYPKAVALVSKFRNQTPPANCCEEERKRWEKNKLTRTKVLGIIYRYIRNQNAVPKKEVALVKTSYGFKLKAYPPHLLDGLEKKSAKMHDLVTGRDCLPFPKEANSKLHDQLEGAKKLVRRKQEEYRLQSQPILEMARLPGLDAYIDTLTFVNKEMETCRFTPLQKHDMGLVFQKRYALLNWQQGSGKTAVAYHYGKYRLERKSVKNVVILAASIAVNMTWEPFLKRNNQPYVKATKASQLENVPEGMFVVVSVSMLSKLEKPLKRFLKRLSQKACLLFDESDKITNSSSARTKAALSIFRKLRYKLFATGTTTRNNIAELYPQLELLYNNSVNMMSYAETVYHEDRDKNITQADNKYYGKPFPPRGISHFRECFCPAKTTVFGIQKQNQDVYNKDLLYDLISKTIVTRKFKEFAGDKYVMGTHTVKPAAGEREVYRVILEEFANIYNLYFKSTGDARKDAAFRLANQIRLLIKACSAPQYLTGYYGDEYPSKAWEIDRLLRRITGKAAVGCTSLAALEMYRDFFAKRFPGRELFVIQGDVPFEKRQKILDKFEATENGILLCTQQSLESSVNIPSCNDVILESLQWNVPSMEQFYFRFIRLDSKGITKVHFVTYEDSIEQNLMALILTKERLNEFIKTGEVTQEAEIFEEFGVSSSIIESLIRREKDGDGKIRLSWGQQKAS